MVTSLFSSTKKADAKRPEVAATAKSDSQPPRPELPARRPQRTQQSPPPPTTVTAEEDELLDGISADLHAVRELAQHQNAAIRQQNQRLDELTDKTQRVNGHMERTRGRIQRIS